MLLPAGTTSPLSSIPASPPQPPAAPIRDISNLMRRCALHTPLGFCGPTPTRTPDGYCGPTPARITCGSCIECQGMRRWTWQHPKSPAADIPNDPPILRTRRRESWCCPKLLSKRWYSNGRRGIEKLPRLVVDKDEFRTSSHTNAFRRNPIEFFFVCEMLVHPPTGRRVNVVVIDEVARLTPDAPPGYAATLRARPDSWDTCVQFYNEVRAERSRKRDRELVERLERELEADARESVKKPSTFWNFDPTAFPFLKR